MTQQKQFQQGVPQCSTLQPTTSTRHHRNRKLNHDDGDLPPEKPRSSKNTTTLQIAPPLPPTIMNRVSSTENSSPTNEIYNDNNVKQSNTLLILAPPTHQEQDTPRKTTTTTTTTTSSQQVTNENITNHHQPHYARLGQIPSNIGSSPDYDDIEAPSHPTPGAFSVPGIGGDSDNTVLYDHTFDNRGTDTTINNAQPLLVTATEVAPDVDALVANLQQRIQEQNEIIQHQHVAPTNHTTVLATAIALDSSNGNNGNQSHNTKGIIKISRRWKMILVGIAILICSGVVVGIILRKRKGGNGGGGGDISGDGNKDNNDKTGDGGIGNVDQVDNTTTPENKNNTTPEETSGQQDESDNTTSDNDNAVNNTVLTLPPQYSNSNITVQEAEERLVRIAQVLIDHEATKDFNIFVLETTTSPQYRAIEWITLADTTDIEIFEQDPDIMMERLIVLTLYFSTINATTTIGSDGSYGYWWEDYPSILVPGESICEWYDDNRNVGISCDNELRVESIDLYDDMVQQGVGLVGTLPTEIGLLSHMKSFDCQHNDLSGTLPFQYGELSQLADLNLARNNLSGILPTELGHLSNLQSLNLAFNPNFHGLIPILSPLLYAIYLQGTALQLDNVQELFCDREFTDLVLNCAPTTRTNNDNDNDANIITIICTCCTQCCNELGLNCM